MNRVSTKPGAVQASILLRLVPVAGLEAETQV